MTDRALIERAREALKNAEQFLDLYVNGFGSTENGKYTLAHVSEVVAELDAARDQPAMEEGWREISTAPVAEMFIYYWPRAGKRAIGLAYRAAGGGWRDSEGNWNERIEPTHWRPLPPPPERKD